MMADEGVVATQESLFQIEGRVRDICKKFEKGSLNLIVFGLENELAKGKGGRYA